MNSIKLDSVLIFALVIPFIMNYRLSPSETPYWLFGFIFLGLLLYLVLDLLKVREELYFKLKSIVLGFLIVAIIGGGFVSAIIVRHQTHPIYMIHDMPLQQEIAIRFLLDGKNPYATNYFDTFLKQWHYSDTEENPALYHFVLMPFYILFALPFYFLSIGLFGFFDARIPLLFLFLLLLLLGSILVKDKRKKLLFVILLAFNPAMLSYTLEGRSDIFMYAFLFIGLFLLHHRKYFLAGIPIALAFTVKQSAWPFLPFYLAFLYFQTKSVIKTMKALIPFVVIFLFIVLPFFLWDKKAFLDSTIFYLSGGAPNSYPISGYGFGMVLREIGVIRDAHQNYPFHIWQLLISLPLLIILINCLKKTSTVSRLILTYGVFLFVFWYFSRYFNNSHLGYLSVVFLTAYFWPQDKIA